MKSIPTEMLQTANREAIYNLYLYLSDKTEPKEGESLLSIISGLKESYNHGSWNSRDIYRLNILKNAIDNDPVLAFSAIGNFTRFERGLTACTFTKPGGDISVVFKGTGRGEWIDNGEGLSGIAEENTYIVYKGNGGKSLRKTVLKDYASDQQVEALNWFNSIAAHNGWNNNNEITVSGHSKGGNKAQFVAIHSDIIDKCFSFNGQGFSPEALEYMERLYGNGFKERKQKIFSFSTDNDYVNVLGKRLIPQENIYYLESKSGLHYMESLLDRKGKFNPQTNQGRLSRYIENVSNDLMSMKPHVRRYATLGVMSIFNKYLGDDVPLNGDSVSNEETLAGLAISIGTIFNNLKKHLNN